MKRPLGTQDYIEVGVGWKTLYPGLANFSNWFLAVISSSLMSVIAIGLTVLASKASFAFGILTMVIMISTVSISLLFSHVQDGPKPLKLAGKILFLGVIIGSILSLTLGWMR